MSDFLIRPDIWVVERKNFLKQYYIVPQYLCKMQAMFANRVHDLASLLCVKVVNDNINGLSKDSAWTQHEDLERLFLCLSIPTRKTNFFFLLLTWCKAEENNYSLFLGNRHHVNTNLFSTLFFSSMATQGFVVCFIFCLLRIRLRLPLKLETWLH